MMIPLVPSPAATSSPTDDQQPGALQQQTMEMMTTAVDIQESNFDATTRRHPFQRRVAFADDEELAKSRACHWRGAGDVITVDDVTIIDVVRAKRRRQFQNSVECGAAKRTKREVSTAVKTESPCSDVMPLQSINYNFDRLRPSITSVTCTYDDITSGYVTMTTTDNARIAPVIPADPRVWSRQDVTNWLTVMRQSRSVDADPERFRMNGKALCLMTCDMFAFRVPQRDGGVVLYKDFQARLCRAVAASLHRSCSTAQ